MNTMTQTIKQLLSKQLFACFFIFLWPLAAQADTLIDRIVAIVNSDVILKSELNEKMLSQQQALASQGIPIPSADILQQKVLDSLILEKLQLERAKQLGIEIPDEQITEQLENIAKQNNMSVIALRKRLNLEKPNGFNTLRNQIKTQLTIKKVREVEILSQIQVSESEIKNLINRQALKHTRESLQLGHILIELPSSPTPQQRQAALEKAEQIHQRLEAGEDFRKLAVQYSDRSNALKGGELGWLKPSEIPSFFNEAIAGLSPGDISPVIQSPNGFHIVKLMDKKEAGVATNTQMYHLHRFILPSDDALQQEKPKELSKLVASLHSIDDFHALKAYFPEIPNEINQHSDLGWRLLNEFPEALQEKITTLQPNQALEPLPTQQGWMVLFLEAVKSIPIHSDHLQQQAMQEIRMRKSSEMFERWLQRLKDEAFIEIKLNNDK
ncbi:MAG TPA: molecular chaperone SurA [Thiomicrorhabdus sp.]|nr:molecular chaperone SurA [Thiomicrorhabdus sp.]